jgi:hypothetical protein
VGLSEGETTERGRAYGGRPHLVRPPQRRNDSPKEVFYESASKHEKCGLSPDRAFHTTLSRRGNGIVAMPHAVDSDMTWRSAGEGFKF